MHMSSSETALKLRTIAARMRTHAAETCVEHFRHKFENVASELEEAAVDADSRARFKERFKLVS
jgi:hypothetical protein